MKRVFIIVVIVMAIIISLFVFSTHLFPSPQGTCEVILENSGEDKVDVVFFTNGVSKSKIENYVDFFLESEPFSLNKEKFNFFYAGKSDCKIVKDNLLFCYSKNLIRESSVCKNDYLVVLSDKPRNIRSTAYMNVISININHPNSVLLHEFGHVFANLADEYVPSILPRGAENCVKTCTKFNNVDGCFQGCSKDNYYRSSESSVMRTLSTDDYKKLNIQLIEEKLEKYE